MLNYSGANRNSFFLNRENQDFDISDISFKELYILVLADNKISKDKLETASTPTLSQQRILTKSMLLKKTLCLTQIIKSAY